MTQKHARVKIQCAYTFLSHTTSTPLFQRANSMTPQPPHPTQERRSAAYGLALATFGLSYCLGPILGGFIAERVSYRCAKYANEQIVLNDHSRTRHLHPAPRHTIHTHRHIHTARSSLPRCAWCWWPSPTSSLSSPSPAPSPTTGTQKLADTCTHICSLVYYIYISQERNTPRGTIGRQSHPIPSHTYSHAPPGARASGCWAPCPRGRSTSPCSGRPSPS